VRIVTRGCARCGASNEPEEKFCGDCGVSSVAAAAHLASKSDEAQIRIAERSASENLEGARKTVTARFAAIRGSTELEQDLDPEEARAMVDPTLKLMIDFQCIATTATSWRAQALGSSRCLVLPLHMKIIRSTHFTLHSDTAAPPHPTPHLRNQPKV
jgi:hypothetical protein